MFDVFIQQPKSYAMDSVCGSGSIPACKVPSPTSCEMMILWFGICGHYSNNVPNEWFAYGVQVKNSYQRISKLPGRESNPSLA